MQTPPARPLRAPTRLTRQAPPRFSLAFASAAAAAAAASGWEAGRRNGYQDGPE